MKTSLLSAGMLKAMEAWNLQTWKNSVIQKTSSWRQIFPIFFGLQSCHLPKKSENTIFD